MVLKVLKRRKTPRDAGQEEVLPVDKQLDHSDLDVNHSHSTMDMSDTESNDEVDSSVDDDISYHGDLLFVEGERVDMDNRLERKDSSSTCTTTSSNSSCRKSVRFSTVQIREYPLCIGDNPSCELGVPIAIDWHPVAEYTTGVNEHQEGVQDRPHKKEGELRLSAQFRDGMVRKAGFTSEQVRRAVQRVNVKKMERRATVDSIPQQSMEEAIERAVRGLWNSTLNRQGKQKEREMLQQWLKQDASKTNKSLLISAPF